MGEEEEVEVLKSFGVYNLTVEPSDMTKGADDKPVVMYCLTNTVTGVREWEDTLFPTILGYAKQLQAVWDEEMDSSVISVPSLVVPH